MIAFEKVSKVYPNGIHGLYDISLKIEDGECLILFGPSGSGKSTILNLACHLIKPTKGKVIVENINRISYVFQNEMLLDHLSVFENIAYGLDRRKYSKDEIEKQVEWAADLCKCRNYLNQKAATLSGGQRQRTALARAIVKKPDLLCMDESFNQLNLTLKFELLDQIRLLQNELNFTLLFVTHSLQEAMNLPGKICFIDTGQILQYDTYNQIYEHPVSIAVAAHFVYPPMNLIEQANIVRGFYPADWKEEAECENDWKIDLLSIEAMNRWENGYLFSVLSSSGNLQIFSKENQLPKTIFVSVNHQYYFDKETGSAI